MEQESDLTKRRAGYQTLLRDVGKQLSKPDTDSIEFSEKVPEDDRGKGGIKLLEHLQNKGRFSLWRTEPLRDVLRSCDRCDLANGLMKDYQLQFPDTDSPLPLHRSSSQLPTPGKSPLISSRHRVQDVDCESTHPTLESFSHVTSTPTWSPEHSAPNSHDITLSSGEEGQRSSLSSPLSDMSNYSPDEQNSLTQDHVFEKLHFAEKFTQTAFSFATKVILGSASQNASREALNSVSTTSLHSSLYSPHSKTSIPSITGTPQARHSRSQSQLDNYYQPNTCSSGNRRFSAGCKPRANPPRGDLELNLQSETEIPQNYDTLNVSTPGSTPQTKPEEEASDGSGSHNSMLNEPSAGRARPSSAKGAIQSIRNKFSRNRPPSAKKKQSSRSCTDWRIKREDLVLAAAKHKDPKRKPITCQNQLEIDIGHAKSNPRMSLSLYPYGLFQDEKKNVTLLATIAHKRVDLVPPDLHIQLYVSVMDDDGRELHQRSTTASVNMSPIHLFGLLSHTDLLSTLQRDHVELRASVQMI